MGEILLKGNVVMKGYLKDEAATEAAFADGWFRSGDLAVVHPSGYAEIKDRAKDIIISGGENISTVEVESSLYRHAAVLEASVVARPDEKWGEVPCAFVVLKEGEVGRRRRRGDHRAPPRADGALQRRSTWCTCRLPKTSTGKVQKLELRSAGDVARRIGYVERGAVSFIRLCNHQLRPWYAHRISAITKIAQSITIAISIRMVATSLFMFHDGFDAFGRAAGACP